MKIGTEKEESKSRKRKFFYWRF